MIKRSSITVGVALAFIAGAFSCALAQTPLEDFDAAWETIRDTHFDPDLNGVDWDAVRTELRPHAQHANRSETRGIILEMLSRLGQSHFALLPKGGGGIEFFDQDGAHTTETLDLPDPRLATLKLIDSETERDPGSDSPGFEVRLIDDAVIVVEVREGSDAWDRGIRRGWELLAIGADPVAPIIIEQVSSVGRRSGGLHVWQIVTAMMMGAEDTTTRVVFVNIEGEELAVTISREPPLEPPVAFGSLPAMSPGFESRWIDLDSTGPERTERIGYIGFDVWLQTIPRQFDAAMLEFKDADGIVIDLRGNIGGIGAMAMLVGRYLVEERSSLGTMSMRDQTLHFNLQPVLVSMSGEDLDPFTGPVAVLIDGTSASTSEIFAAGIQELGRARLFGQPSPGLALPAMLSTLPSGDVLMHAMAGFETPNGISMEAAGVTPDVHTPWDLQSLRAGHDATLDAATRWIIFGEE